MLKILLWFVIGLVTIVVVTVLAAVIGTLGIALGWLLPKLILTIVVICTIGWGVSKLVHH